MTTWKNNVKEVVRSDEPTENDQLHLQFRLALQSFIVTFSSLFSCPVSKFTVLIHRSHNDSR